MTRGAFDPTRTDERGLARMQWSVTALSVVLVAMAVIGLAKGNGGWPLVPLLAGCPTATVLVVRGRRGGRVATGITGTAVLVATVCLAALLFELTG
ncbi:hypothetical protein KNE206_24250 [Kitasatospora sp. NE20-6]|uniref:hypothetical protein n=1 Tax=Kitasatospora sp. NE20-6 TaxID=2859066 RepID=UPI0034DBC661